MAKAELEALRERVERLETHVGRLTEALARADALLTDDRRLTDLAERAGQLSAAADAAVQAIQGRAAAAGVGLPRWRPRFNVVYRASATGYVSIFFVGGRTDKPRLLVGAQDPPTESACEANTVNDANSYAGGVVRQGEYWTVASKHSEKSGFGCVFTPLF